MPQVGFGRADLFDIIFVMLGGLPLFLPLAFLAGEQRMTQQIPFDWLFWANQLVSLPHVMASYVRLERKIQEKKAHPLLGSPAYLVILMLLSLATITGHIVVAMTVVNVWQSYHFLRQVWGVDRYFSRYSGESALERKLTFWAFHGAMPFFVIGRWNMLYQAWHGKPSEYIIPVAFPDWLLISLGTLALASLLIGLLSEAFKFRRAVQSATEYNISNLLVLITYFGIHWLGFLSIQFYFIGFFAITLFHAIQYLAITWKYEISQNQTNTFTKRLIEKIPRAYSYVAFCVLLYFVGDLFEKGLFSFGNMLWPKLAATCLSSMSTHHYLIDSIVWRKQSGV